MDQMKKAYDCITWGLAWSRPARLICAMFLCCALLTFTSVAAQQLDGSENKPVPAKATDGKPEPPGKVDVQPVAKDDEIRQRIADILKTTGWFGEPKVTVQEGIVFLKGTTENDESKQWAGDLAKNTEGVVAVVNQIEVAPTTVWNFDPTFQVLNDLARGFLRLLPLIVVALVVIAISWIFARLTVYLLRRGLLGRSLSRLLREVHGPGWRNACHACRPIPCAPYRRAHATRADVGGWHRPDWFGAGHRIPRHHREFSRQSLSELAATVS